MSPSFRSASAPEVGLVAALAVVGFVPQAALAEWPQAGHDAAGSGRSEGTGAITAALDALPGQSFAIASPVVDSTPGILVDLDGPAYVAASRQRVIAYSADGDVLWTSPAVGATHVVGEVDLLGTGRTQILVADAAIGGGIHLLDAATGALLWSFTDLAFASGVEPREVVLADFDGDGVDEMAFTGWIYGAPDVHLVDLSTIDGAPRLASVPLSGTFLGLTELVAVDALDEPGIEIVVPMSWDLDVVRTCGSTDVGASCDDVDATVCLCEVGLLTDVWTGRAFPRPVAVDVDADGREELFFVNQIGAWDHGFGIFDVQAALDSGPLARWYYDYTGSGLPLGIGPPQDLDGDAALEVVVTVFDAGTDEVDLSGGPVDDGLHNPGGFSVGVFNAATGAPIASLDDHYALGLVDFDGDGAPEIVTQATTGRTFAGALHGWELVCDPGCALEEAWTTPDWSGIRRPERFDVAGFPPRRVLERTMGGLLLWRGDRLESVPFDGAAIGGVDFADDDVLAAWAPEIDAFAVLEASERIRIYGANGAALAPSFAAESNAPPRWSAAVLDASDERAIPVVDGHVYRTVLDPRDRADADVRLGDDVLLIDDLDPDGGTDLIVYSEDESDGTVSISRVRGRDFGVVWRWDSGGTVDPEFLVRSRYLTIAADFNGDGIKDITIDLRRGYESVILVLDGSSGAILHRASVSNRRAFYTPPLALDLVGDERPELVRVSERHIAVWEIGSSEPTLELTSRDFLVRATWWDIDADGTLELIAGMSFQADRTEISAYRLLPTLELVWSVTDLPAPPDVEQALAILGLGGEAHVAWISADGSVDALRASDGVRASGFPFAVGTGPLTALVVFDVDGDGLDEVVAGSKDGWIHAIDPEGPTVQWSFFAGSEIVNLGAADVDGDGDAEILASTGDGLARVIDAMGVSIEITSPTPGDCIKQSPLPISGTSLNIDGVSLSVAGASASATLEPDGTWTAVVDFPLVDGLIEVVATGTVAGVPVAFDSLLLPSNEDIDGDGWTTCGGDCDETDARRFPGAEEVCNGVDDDCDPTTAEPECAGVDDEVEGCSCDGCSVDGRAGAGPWLLMVLFLRRRR
jgi:outer membrane protein assembly factor BamB